MKKTKKGSGLIFAVILLFVILAMVVTLSSVTVLETKMSQKSKSSVGAFYNADSGVEWALNLIATGTGPNISNVFGANFNTSTGKVTCPIGYGCEVYLLDDSGKVIASDNTIDKVKAVRSVGTQNIGGAPDTQRAIEAAVAAGGGGCYVSYGKPPIANRAAAPNDNCITGFTDKGSAGIWGYCYDPGSSSLAFRPPSGVCPVGYTVRDSGDAFICCM